MPRYPRYAIYYTPAPGSRWWRFGCEWLGRDPISGKTFAPLPLPALGSAEIRAMTATPRRYGFHATLKAPFALAYGSTVRDLHRALSPFACAREPIELGNLRLRSLDGFVSLRPVTTPALREFAQACVAHFDTLRATPDNAELARRRQAPLTSRQEELLRRWGYPYVAEEFRFHFTLTDHLAEDRRRAVFDGLAPFIEPLNTERLCIDALCLFEQPTGNAPFRLQRRYGFDGSLARYERDVDTTCGRLFYLVGPSGAGKDTLLRYAKARLGDDRAIVFAHRYITRAADNGGENHVALDEIEFRRRQDAGAFAMAWQSHGYRYGIGIEIDHWLAQGLDVVVNGSRAYLPQARARYPQMTVISVIAPTNVLAARLAQHGREGTEATARRLKRAEMFELPRDATVVEIRNDSAAREAGEKLLRVLNAKDPAAETRYR